LAKLLDQFQDPAASIRVLLGFLFGQTYEGRSLQGIGLLFSETVDLILETTNGVLGGPQLMTQRLNFQFLVTGTAPQC
jgi:hypothetical protein